MATPSCPITTELISDYAAGRLDAEDVRVVEEAVDRDETVATAVAVARQLNSRMITSLAQCVEARSTIVR